MEENFDVYTECPYCRSISLKKCFVFFTVDGKQIITDESLAKFMGLIEKEEKDEKENDN